MLPEQATGVLTLLEAGWPKGPWPQETEDLWLRHLVSYEFDDAKAAVEWMLTRQEYTPTMAHWATAIGAVRAEARRLAELARPALGSGPRPPVSSKAKAAARGLMNRAKEVEHDHHSRWTAVLDDEGQPVLDEHSQPVRRRISGIEACPVCSLHDHSDTRIAGYERGMDVKCYELACPRCGNLELSLDKWTQAGVEVGRAVGAKFSPTMTTQEKIGDF